MTGPEDEAECTFRRAQAAYDAMEDPRYLEPEDAEDLEPFDEDEDDDLE